MTKFKKYVRNNISLLRPYEEGEILPENVSISQFDKDKGSPRVGDMIAMNPNGEGDMWLVAEKYFKDNFEVVKD